jgi:hypothetical protein
VTLRITNPNPDPVSIRLRMTTFDYVWRRVPLRGLPDVLRVPTGSLTVEVVPEQGARHLTIAWLHSRPAVLGLRVRRRPKITWLPSVRFAADSLDNAMSSSNDGVLLYAAGWVLFGWILLELHVDGAHPSAGFGAWLSLFVITVVAVGFVVVTSFWRRWRYWGPARTRIHGLLGWGEELLVATGVLTMLAIAMVTVSCAAGWSEASPVPDTDRLLEDARGFVLWQLLESVPIFQLTDTFPLQEPVDFDGWSIGLILTAYRLLLLIPVVGVVRAAWSAHQARPSHMGSGRVLSQP